MRGTNVFLFILTVASCQALAAKKECAGLLTKLDNIMSSQRQSHSLKKSISLREREDKAREKWWDCENNKGKYKDLKQLKKRTKKPIQTNKPEKMSKAAPVFTSNNTIVMRGRFSGEKQFKWLAYYKRPQECIRPKTTQVFAYCMENKTAQQQEFEQQYKK